MPEILIVYASTHGHTGRIAERIATVLEARGAHVDLSAVADAGGRDPCAYDAVVAGGSIHLGSHQEELVAWAHRNARRLNARPSAFFSVCLAVADDSDEAREQAQDWIDDFADDTGWTPRVTASFAGALQYREYDPFTRLLMRLLMARGDHPTDVRQDVDYTDWAAVEAFARTVAELAAIPAGSG